MSDNRDEEPAEPLAPPRELHPLPRGLVELYGLLAVLFVLVPEWMAGGALFSFREGRKGSELPVTAQAWQRVPELRLASLTMAGLRNLAREERLRGYAALARDRLTQRLLKKLARRPQPRKALW
ncbi:MAG: hypothetical protein FJ083_09835 [Cyanobacteria bacterium K_Offshore_surface_m2_239]|nr:hypothetical protein [Cyanobacteria bacterium K_Offshore_surface_m2_239]